MVKGKFLFGVLLASSVIVGTIHAQEAQAEHEKIADLVYGKVADRELLLDIYLPEGVNNPPLLIWVHGGAWRGGTKDSVPILDFVEDGYAIASLDFRLSGEGMFPAQVHDIKAAIRFLRAKAGSHGYDAEKVALLGASSGGHLVSLVGVTNGDRELEGDIGDFVAENSDVQAVVSYYGASNLTTILSQSTPHGLSVRKPALDLFIGGQPEDNTARARQASPVFHVDRSDPPLLLLHGDQDPQMPINQSHELHHAYNQHGLEVAFEVVHGAAHGGAEFVDEQRRSVVLAFLNKHLK
jgi:acetyl esterase/lipase